MTPMRILVVDDEHGAGTLLGIALRRLGHEPLLALHPHDALAMFDAEIDAVITDLEMPQMNGVELARALRRQRAHIPLVFCTGSDGADALATEAAAISRVFPKRWNLDHVRTMLAALTTDTR